MTKYEIEKGIEIDSPSCVGKPPKYPFRDMRVGESIFVNAVNKKKAISAAHVFNFRTEIKLKCRTQPCGGVRIWRVA
ncbi:MAG: hypothetical protein Tp136SUR676911_5 [Prokaryotic dsDNA virus sp.]|nr:MAG: hypothetical protein Tp136SUR676911_5 [Prokaryotic dsDNA virus sp.]